MRMTTAHCTPVGASKLFVEGGRGVAGGGCGWWGAWLVEGVAGGRGLAGGRGAAGGKSCPPLIQGLGLTASSLVK